ncbi:hypothetical protein Tco_1188908, partial [Tanacetum coccineum]
MAQQQHAADVHPDELCPPNKRYDLMDANKKVDLEHVQCLPESKILTNIIKNHPLRFSIAASSSVPWIYMAQFWHTLKEDGSKYRLSIRIYNGVNDAIEFQDYWSSAAMANIMQNILQMLNNTSWMFTDEMKQTEHYQMYAEVFGIDVPLTQSQPTESTQGMHRTPSTPRSPNPDKEAAELISLAEHKSREDQEARENVALVDEHLASEEIEKIVDGQENIVDDSLIPRNDEPNIPCTRIEPQSDKESSEVEIAKEKEVEISKENEVELTNVVIPVNVNDEDKEITDEVYELKKREKGKLVEETRNSPIPTPIRSPRIHTNLVSSDTEKLQELTDTPHTTSSSSSPHKKLAKMNRLLSLFKTKPTRFKRYKSFFHELQGRYGYLFAHLRARFMPRKSFDTLADNLHDNQVPVYVAEGLILERQKAKEETERLIAKAILQERGNIQAQISTQIENAIANVIPSQVDASMKFERNTVLQTACRTPAVRPRDQDDLHDDAHPKGENSAKRQKTSEYEAYVSRESSSGQVFQEEQATSTSGNQEQDDDFDFWTDSYASDDDEIPTKQVSQDIMEEVSLTIDESKLRKMANEMLRQRCTSGDEHQYHIDQMKNFLKSDIVW